MSDGVAEALATLESLGRLRDVRALVPRSAVHVRWGERSLRLFSSNDYLGLSHHPAVRAAAAEAAAERGMGLRGAALICGYSEQHEDLEVALAALKGAGAALLFPTGYQANLGVLAALGGPDAAIFSDALNHASIVDGCRLSRARVHVYRHRDLDHLDTLLRESGARRKVVVTDSVFSMDGEAAPLADLVVLKRRHGALLVADEAHATLVYGPTGGGLTEETGTAAEVDFQVGTLSKAIGAQGGFVACSAERRRWLLNVARTFIFTTALPAPVVAAARAALDVAAREPLRDRLWSHVRRLAGALGRPPASPIVPIVVGDELGALAASESLLDRGHLVPAIRPPTVPPGTCRLRVTLSAAHSEEDVDALVAALRLAAVCGSEHLQE